MKFNINDYEGNYVMHCKTEEEAKDFAGYMISVDRPLVYSLSCCYGDNVSFFNEGTWSSKNYAKKANYTILEWSDFMNKEFTKADLKTGDVVKFRNGKTGIVNGELHTIISRSSWDDLDNYKDNLTSVYGFEQFDIMMIRRPKVKGDCQFIAFDHNWGTLVYERKEVEEMTLEQVCKLLGKEIKIVK